MNTNTFLLFFACLLFSGFCFYWNIKVFPTGATTVALRFTLLAFALIGLVYSLVVIMQSLSAL